MNRRLSSRRLTANINLSKVRRLERLCEKLDTTHGQWVDLSAPTYKTRAGQDDVIILFSQTRGKGRNVGWSDSRCRRDLNKSTHCRGLDSDFTRSLESTVHTLD
jgi:hypothetical protein